MQRGYCSVATRYSPGLVRQQAFSSPEASLKVVCGSSSLVSLGLLMLVITLASISLPDCYTFQRQASQARP